jgi:hypothetical protein
LCKSIHKYQFPELDGLESPVDSFLSIVKKQQTLVSPVIEGLEEVVYQDP